MTRSDSWAGSERNKEKKDVLELEEGKEVLDLVHRPGFYMPSACCVVSDHIMSGSGMIDC